MSFGIIKIPLLTLEIKGSLCQAIEDSGCDGYDITEIHSTALRDGRAITMYKKDAKMKNALNKLLGVNFRSVLRCEKNMEESVSKGCITLDGDLLIFKEDETWIQISCSEWGSISSL